MDSIDALVRSSFPVALAACLVFAGHAQPAANWAAAKSRHFEVYAQGDQKTARSGLAWLEELRAFVAQQTGLNPDSTDPVRVIAFGSAREYAPYRLHSGSDAYYVGSGNRHYLVLPSLEPQSFGTAAHEYAHYLFQLAGLDLPRWLREGMAEVFSSVRIGDRGSQIGGDLPERSGLLQRTTWIPLEQILASAPSDERDRGALFYSESWALTEMLAISPEYRSGFRLLVTAIASGVPSREALTRVYGKPLALISADLRSRAGKRHAMPLGPVALPAATSDAADVAPFEVRLMLAECLLLAEEFDHAESLYRDLEREAPNRAEVLAGLGAIALSRGDSANARLLWKRAIERGLTDSDVCYRYALLLDKDGQSPDDLRAALEQVVRLRPDFEEARFRLGLLEENAGRHEAALAQLNAIRPVPAVHAYHYWISVTAALLALDRNREAADAAHKAVEHASTPEERAAALQLARMARTHPAVQFTRGADGRLILTTTRAPNESSDWNAFIEPDDDLRRVEGTLREIECGESGLRMRVDAPSGGITVSIPDPTHVLMRNAPADFVCGPQAPRTVLVEYAASKNRESGSDGIARGIEFKK